MRRGTVLRTLGALALTVLLVACKVDTTVDVAVLADGTGTVTVTVVADNEVLAAEPGLATELDVKDLIATGWKVDGPTETEDGGLRVVVSHTFANVTQANVLLRSLSGSSGLLRKPSLVAKGSGGSVRWTLTGQLDFSKGLSALADQQLLTTLGGAPWSSSLALHNVAAKDAASITLNVTLPGRALGADGKPVPEPAAPFTWTVRPGDGPVSVTARSSIVSEKVVKARRLEKKVALILGVYVAVMALAGLVWWNVRKRRPPQPRRPRRSNPPKRPSGPRSGARPPQQPGNAPARRPQQATPQNGERRPPQGRTPHGR